MRRGRAIFWVSLATLLGLALLAGLQVVRRVRAALPVTDGRLVVSGLGAHVEIVRDRDGVPHIFAASDADVMFGLGFVHAQDRLWQMEVQRRLAHGRLAEILGPPAVQVDRLFRTLGISRAAAQALEHYSAETRMLIDAYVAGVNALWSTRSRRTLPIEFALLGVRPEPWRPVDVVAWAKVMAWALDGNWRSELLRASISARLGADRAADLMPAFTPDGPLIVRDLGWLTSRPVGVASPHTGAGARVTPTSGRVATLRHRLLAAAQEVERLTGLGVPGSGSNSWVVAGARTTTGGPLLASDPHLPVQLPSTWYLAHLEGDRYQAIGATLPGAPGVVIGHNGRIAWGLTNVMADVQDLYVERVHDWRFAAFDGALEPMSVRHETIRVKGAPDVPLAVRATRHGPIVSDVVDDGAGVGTGAALALRWTALDPTDGTVEALLEVGRAGSWDAFVRALSHFHSAMQNVVYADVEGHIGYYAAGALPIRAAGDGMVPVPGWTREHEWRGYVPFEQLPHAFDPPDGVIVTANNRVVGEQYPWTIGTTWEPPYRAARILERVDATPKLSSDDLAAIQADVVSGQAQRLLPVLTRLEGRTDRERVAIALLRTWDARVAAESAAAAVYEAWLAEIPPALLGDDLGVPLLADYLRDTRHVALALHTWLAEGRLAQWCDDVRTPAEERCEAVLLDALARGLDTMARTQGGADPSGWRWDRANEVRFGHRPFDTVFWLRPWFSRRVAVGGDRVTVNPVMRVRGETIAPSYRQIVDLRHPDASRFGLAPGQSGQLGSRHYADQLAGWREVSHRPMRWRRAAIEAAAAGRLRLEPAR